MNNANVPSVLFPNLLTGLHTIVLDFLYYADKGGVHSVLPGRHRHLRAGLPDGYVPERQSLEEVYRDLGKVEYKDLGEIQGTNLKYLFGDTANILFKRAIACCRRVQELCQSNAGISQIKNARDWEFFAKDITILHTILESRRVFIHANLLTEYLGRLESVQNYAGHNETIDALCRKIRAMTRPQKSPMPRPEEVRQATEQANEFMAGQFRGMTDPESAA